MPIHRFYKHGLTAGTPPTKNNHLRAKRGKVGGWTHGATRRNTAFLYSVRDDQLDGLGYAVTFTLKHCPATSRDWHALRRKLEWRLRRMGMVRMHWVTEWQRRGVPHLHGALWLSLEVMAKHPRHLIHNALASAWLLAGAIEYGASHSGQHVNDLTDAAGWFKYLSKHASRGLSHYQRSPENIPEAWRNETGRMWGKIGAWPVQEPVKINLEGAQGDGGYFAFRRLVRSWRVADARADLEHPRRLALAKSMLACPERKLSTVRGVSEWVPESVQHAMLRNLADRGYNVTC